MGLLEFAIHEAIVPESPRMRRLRMRSLKLLTRCLFPTDQCGRNLCGTGTVTLPKKDGTRHQRVLERRRIGKVASTGEHDSVVES